MIKIEQVKLPFGAKERELERILKKELFLRKNTDLKRIDKPFEKGMLPDRGNDKTVYYRILRRSLDCRRKPELFYIFSIGIYADKKTEELILKASGKGRFRREEEIIYEIPLTDPGDKALCKTRPVIVGDGPAGLFCALSLTLSGLEPIVLERGGRMEERKEKVNSFWKEGSLDPDSNVLFGEGGAGTFSDGKLNSTIKDRAGRIYRVLSSFVHFGADSSILYDQKPHVGTDRLAKIIPAMREELEKRGCEFRFNSKALELILQGGRAAGLIVERQEKTGISRYELLSDHIVLATGHSARDTISRLYSQGLFMEQKDFAMGFRVLHPQELIDRACYGDVNCVKDPEGKGYKNGLLPADYKLSYTAGNKRRIYSFCMCPGGYVVNSSSEEGRLCINGMSYSGRDSGWADSAIVAAIESKEFGSAHPLSGIELQRRLEEKTFSLCKGRIPVQTLGDFRRAIRRSGDVWRSGPEGMKLPIKGDYCFSDISGIFPEDINSAISEAMEVFDRRIPGFGGEDTLFCALEARTSSPVRIKRDEETFRAGIGNVYPCGEGAGYAGGIMSAAVDGLKVAEKIILSVKEGVK